jgi:hypothetical protein
VPRRSENLYRDDGVSPVKKYMILRMQNVVAGKVMNPSTKTTGIDIVLPPRRKLADFIN